MWAFLAFLTNLSWSEVRSFTVAGFLADQENQELNKIEITGKHTFTRKKRKTRLGKLFSIAKTKSACSSGGSSRIFMGGAGQVKRARLACGARAAGRVSPPSELRQGSGGTAPGKFLGYYTFKSAFLQ